MGRLVRYPFRDGTGQAARFRTVSRLAHLSDRKLYLPRGLDVPESLRGIVRETVSTRAITKGWDPLLRIAASTKSGWCSATYILDRFGSAPHGDVAFQAGDALGKLLRTRYLVRYLSDQDFRTHIHALLNQGEASTRCSVPFTTDQSARAAADRSNR